MVVLYDYESNTILTNPFKNHTTQELVRAQTRLFQYILDQGMKPSALRIDNKCPEALLSFFRANSFDVQL